MKWPKAENEIFKRFLANSSALIANLKELRRSPSFAHNFGPKLQKLTLKRLIFSKKNDPIFLFVFLVDFDTQISRSDKIRLLSCSVLSEIRLGLG
jgi:hypothetical protein